MTEFLSISSSSEEIDDEQAGKGGVAGRGFEGAIGVEIIARPLAFRVWETGASLSADIYRTIGKERSWAMSRIYFSLRKPGALIGLACNQSHPSSAITPILSQ